MPCQRPGGWPREPPDPHWRSGRGRQAQQLQGADCRRQEEPTGHMEVGKWPRWWTTCTADRKRKGFLGRAFRVLGADGIGGPLAVMLSAAITNVACSSVDNGSIADEIVVLSQSILGNGGNRLLAISRRCGTGLERSDLRGELQRTACASVRVTVVDEVLVLIEHSMAAGLQRLGVWEVMLPYTRSSVLRIASHRRNLRVRGWKGSR